MKPTPGELKREEAWGAQVASLRKAYAKLKKERDQLEEERDEIKVRFEQLQRDRGSLMGKIEAVLLDLGEAERLRQGKKESNE